MDSDKINWTYESAQIAGLIGIIVIMALIVGLISYPIIANCIEKSKKKKTRDSFRKAKENYLRRKDNGEIEPNLDCYETDKKNSVEDDYNLVKKIVGVRKPINAIPLVDLVLDGNYRELAREICKHFRIKNPNIIIKEEATDGPIIRGESRGVANIKLKEKEPIFGTNDFNYQTIEITIFNGCKDFPDLLIYTFAHEISHKILHSLDRNRLRGEKDERQTDICAIINGFVNSYEAARKINNIGYLNEKESEYIIRKYKSEIR